LRQLPQFKIGQFVKTIEQAFDFVKKPTYALPIQDDGDSDDFFSGLVTHVLCQQFDNLLHLVFDLTYLTMQAIEFVVHFVRKEYQSVYSVQECVKPSA